MPGWIEECDRHNLNLEIPRILVGNKCDMTDIVAVNTNLAQKFADSHTMPLFETSAKDEEKANHIDAIFLTLAHKLKNSKPMMSPYIGPGGYPNNVQVVTIGKSPESRGLERMGAEDKQEQCSC